LYLRSLWFSNLRHGANSLWKKTGWDTGEASYRTFHREQHIGFSLRGNDIVPIQPPSISPRVFTLPLRSLINQILDLRGNYGRVIILYGARSPKDLLFQSELIEWAARSDVELHLTVDHPDSKWENSVGVITTLFDAVEI